MKVRFEIDRTITYYKELEFTEEQLKKIRCMYISQDVPTLENDFINFIDNNIVCIKEFESEGIIYHKVEKGDCGFDEVKEAKDG